MTPDQLEEAVPPPLLENNDSPMGNSPSKIAVARFIGAGILTAVLSMAAFWWSGKVNYATGMKIFPGLIFGIYLAVGFGTLQITGGWRLGLLTILSTLGYWTAFSTAYSGHSFIQHVWMLGISGGAAGTGILAASIWFAAPRLRVDFPWRTILRTGVLAGALLFIHPAWFIFVWQSVMAILIALVLLGSPLRILRDRLGTLGREGVLWLDVVLAVLVAILLAGTAIKTASTAKASASSPPTTAPGASPPQGAQTTSPAAPAPTPASVPARAPDHTPPDAVRQTAQTLIREGGLQLSGNIRCLLHDERGLQDAYKGDDAEALLKVAAERDIYVFMHGFQTKAFGGKPSEEEVFATWSGHLAALQRIGGKQHRFAACLMRCDTRAGFGPHEPLFGDFLLALRWLTDDPNLQDSNRRITLVAHSAGGNFVKDGLLGFQNNLKASGLNITGRVATPMRILFLATPHQGSTTADAVAFSMPLVNLLMEPGTDRKPRSIREREEMEMQARKRAANEYVTTSPGARQLSFRNPELRELNANFSAAQTANLSVINIFSRADIAVSPDAAQLEVGKTYAVDSMSHDAFLLPDSDASFRDFIDEYYAPLATSSK